MPDGVDVIHVAAVTAFDAHEEKTIGLYAPDGYVVVAGSWEHNDRFEYTLIVNRAMSATEWRMLVRRDDDSGEPDAFYAWAACIRIAITT